MFIHNSCNRPDDGLEMSNASSHTDYIVKLCRTALTGKYTSFMISYFSEKLPFVPISLKRYVQFKFIYFFAQEIKIFFLHFMFQEVITTVGVLLLLLHSASRECIA